MKAEILISIKAVMDAHNMTEAEARKFIACYLIDLGAK